MCVAKLLRIILNFSIHKFVIEMFFNVLAGGLFNHFRKCFDFTKNYYFSSDKENIEKSVIRDDKYFRNLKKKTCLNAGFYFLEILKIRF